MKNKEIIVTIEDLTYEGFGVAKIAGMPVFIENTLPDEVVKIKIVKVTKRFAYGKVLEFLKTSVNRVPLKDKIGTRIGTMPLQHLAYPAQLKFKQEHVRKVLSKMVSLEAVVIHETLGMDNPWEYRNKAQIPVRMIKGQLETGFFKRGSHDLIPIENYYIQDPKIDAAIVVIRDLLRQYHLTAYDEQQHTGDIRHIIVRRGYATGEMMIILVTLGHDIPELTVVAQAIKEALPQVVSIVRNINKSQGNVILGDKQELLYGDDVYHDVLLGKTFAISSRSFYQVNSQQTAVLYETILALAKLQKDEVVIDAYCGIGTISLNLADQAKHVYAVEVVTDAIAMAKKNAMINKIDNVTFEVGSAETLMAKWVESGLKVDVLVVDPPRKGLDASFIAASVATHPKRIIYVSCNSATLARDIALYEQYGYRLTEVQPIDMFPQTVHIETVVLMARADK